MPEKILVVWAASTSRSFRSRVTVQRHDHGKMVRFAGGQAPDLETRQGPGRSHPDTVQGKHRTVSRERGPPGHGRKCGADAVQQPGPGHPFVEIAGEDVDATRLPRPGQAEQSVHLLPALGPPQPEVGGQELQT